MKKLLDIQRNHPSHWVGDGFPVRTMFSYHDPSDRISPFLLLDYGGPAHFEPSRRPRGVGKHPHRGFETVTIVYDGEVEHGDSAGNKGKIGPGDVQWMTAASGIIHEEFHSHAFSERGGRFEMVQLWVNLPARDKMSPPRYQEILDRQIPSVALADGAGLVRVIAGKFGDSQGPAKTFTPLAVLDVRLAAGHQVELPAPAGHNAMLVVLSGTVAISGEEATDASLVLFDRAGQGIAVDCRKDTKALLLSGEPIAERVVGQGPFVMNSEEEIYQAIRDYESGRMGQARA